MNLFATALLTGLKLPEFWVANLVDAGLKGIFLIAITAFFAWMLKRSTAAMRHLVWTLGLTALLVLPTLSIVTPAWHLDILPNRLTPESVAFGVLLEPDNENTYETDKNRFFEAPSLSESQRELILPKGLTGIVGPALEVAQLSLATIGSAPFIDRETQYEAVEIQAERLEAQVERLETQADLLLEGTEFQESEANLADAGIRLALEAARVGLEEARRELEAEMPAIEAEISAGLEEARRELEAEMPGIEAEINAGFEEAFREIKAAQSENSTPRVYVTAEPVPQQRSEFPQAEVATFPSNQYVIEQDKASGYFAGWHWTTWIGLVWIGGALAIILKLLIGTVCVWWIGKKSTPFKDESWSNLMKDLTWQLDLNRPVALLQSPWETMPMTWGTRKPVILLPSTATEWDENRRRMVLLHELSHIQRRDTFTQAIAQIACALHWFNPLVWYAANRMKAERELACDNNVIFSGAKASEYAKHLLEIAHSFRGSRVPKFATLAMARPSELEGRLLSILDPEPNRSGLTTVHVAVATSLVMCILIPLAVLQPHAASSTQTQEMMMAQVAPVSSMPSPISPVAPLLPKKVTGTVNYYQDESGVDWVHVSDAETGESYRYEYSTNDDGWVDDAFKSKTTRFPQRELLNRTINENVNRNTNVNLNRNVNRNTNTNNTENNWAFSYEGEGNHLRLDENHIDLNVDNQSFGLSWQNEEDCECEDDNSRSYIQDSLTVDQIIRLKKYGVSLEFVSAVRAAGFPNIDLDDIIDMARYGVDVDYINMFRKSDIQNLDAEGIVGMKKYGVTAEFYQGVRDAGFDHLTAEEIADMKKYGLNVDYIEGFAAQGLEDFCAEDIIDASKYSVTPEYIATIRDLGFTDIDLEEIIDMRKYGVEADYIRSLAKVGMIDMDAEEIINMRKYGVEATYIRMIQDAGFDDIDNEDIIDMRKYGVEATYIKALADMGLSDLDAEDIIGMRKYGVEIDYIRMIRNAGFDDIDNEDIIDMRKYGVEAEYIKSLAAVGLTGLDAEEIIELRKHGITADYVRNVQQIDN